MALLMTPLQHPAPFHRVLNHAKAFHEYLPDSVQIQPEEIQSHLTPSAPAASVGDRLCSSPSVRKHPVHPVNPVKKISNRGVANG
jgi:hypothetical protein